MFGVLIPDVSTILLFYNFVNFSSVARPFLSYFACLNRLMERTNEQTHTQTLVVQGSWYDGRVKHTRGVLTLAGRKLVGHAHVLSFEPPRRYRLYTAHANTVSRIYLLHFDFL